MTFEATAVALSQDRLPAQVQLRAVPTEEAPPEVIGLCFRLPTVDLPEGLTVAQRRIVRGLIAGESTRDIAVHAQVSGRTVAVQLHQLFQKFSARSRYALLAKILNSNGENLNPQQLSQRTRVFAGSAAVFNGELLLDERGSGFAPVRPCPTTWSDPSGLWHEILAGELVVMAARELGDLRFLTLMRNAHGESGLEALCMLPQDLTLLRGLGSGHSHQQIARDLGVSQSTVSHWAKRALPKLGLCCRAELLRVVSTGDA